MQCSFEFVLGEEVEEGPKRVDEKKRSEKQSERFVLGKDRIRECFNVRDRRRIFVLKAQADLWCLLLWLVVADLG